MKNDDKTNNHNEITFIRKRCPHLNENELKEAEESFREYIRLCLEIYENDEEVTD